MNSFPGLNKNNGLVGPSSCDLETMRSVYQQERQVATARSNSDKRPEAVRTDSALPLVGLEREASAVKPFGDKRPGQPR